MVDMVDGRQIGNVILHLHMDETSDPQFRRLTLRDRAPNVGTAAMGLAVLLAGFWVMAIVT